MAGYDYRVWRVTLDDDRVRGRVSTPPRPAGDPWGRLESVAVWLGEGRPADTLPLHAIVTETATDAPDRTLALWGSAADGIEPTHDLDLDAIHAAAPAEQQAVQTYAVADLSPYLVAR